VAVRRYQEVIMTTTLLRIVIALAAVFVLPKAARSAEAHWPETLTIGTGSPGGTYYDYGKGLANLLTRKLDMPIFMRSTEGPTENIKLLEDGEIQLAFVTLGVAQQGWNGVGEWTGGKRFRAIRAIFPMYDTPFQFMVLQESGIRSVAELTDRRVGIGPQGGTTGIYMPEFFKILKISPMIRAGSWSDLAAAMQTRSLDALAVGAGVPFPEFANLEKRNKVRYLALTADQVVALRLAIPELGSSVVPAGAYPSLARNYQTVGLYNFAVAHRALPDDLVSAIVESVFTNNDEMMQIHNAAASTVPANFTRNTILPFHGGAVRWYQNNSASGILHGD
jgi:TRAP transporter TAXI family solute receptor